MKLFHQPLSRRRALAVLGAAPLGFGIGVHAETLPEVTVHRDPNCGCCRGWAAHLRYAGVPVKLVQTAERNAIKQRLGVPAELSSCHTGELAGYVVEGHVPLGAIRRLLAEKPEATGLAVPGMPIGSPGMESPNGKSDTYEVVLFGSQGRRTYTCYLGDREI